VKRLGIFVVIAALLIIGGGLTTLIPPGTAPEALPGAIVTTNDPEASVFHATPWQTQWLVILIGFIAFNMVGMAVTLAIVMWFLNRGVAKAKAQPEGDGTITIARKD
jgi:hypothetical protein